MELHRGLPRCELCGGRKGVFGYDAQPRCMFVHQHQMGLRLQVRSDEDCAELWKLLLSDSTSDRHIAGSGVCSTHILLGNMCSSSYIAAM